MRRHRGAGVRLSDPAQKNQLALLTDTVDLFAASGPASGELATATTIDKGHGRLERRTIRVSSDLAGYSAFPGLAQVAELTTQTVRLATGEVTHETRYLITSLGPDQADAARLLAVARRHWGIENRWFHVADDSFGEDRQVLQDHDRGLVLGLLRTSALNLLRGACPLWTAVAPMTARAEWAAGRPLTILSGL